MTKTDINTAFSIIPINSSDYNLLSTIMISILNITIPTSGRGLFVPNIYSMAQPQEEEESSFSSCCFLYKHIVFDPVASI